MPLHGAWQQASSLSQEGLACAGGQEILKGGVTSSQLSPSSPVSDGNLLAKWKKQGYENLPVVHSDTGHQFWDKSFAKSPKAS